MRWLLFLAGALLFAPSIVLVQLPLQGEVSRFLAALVGTEAYMRDILVLSIPAVILSGLVQEAAKLIPIAVYYYLIRKRQTMPRFTLSMGALVGAGYGVVEAQWLLNAIFAAGFNLELVSTYGLIALAGFWERFFTIALHTATGAVMGWGVARGKWWLYYIIAVVWHSLLNYSVILYNVGILSSFHVELIIALMADIAFIGAFYLRWRNLSETELEKMAPAEVVPPGEPIVATEAILPAQETSLATVTLQPGETELPPAKTPSANAPDESPGGAANTNDESNMLNDGTAPGKENEKTL